MSDDGPLDMESEDQIEDGELLRSPLKQSPIQLSKEMDDTVFTMSEDEADDTADSLDIKPPQAAILHHHHHKSGSRSGGSSKRDKHSDSGRRDHVHPSKSDMSSRRKTHHRSREHRERREERIREKHHHRERREQMPSSRGESKRSGDGRGGGSSSSKQQQQQERGDRMLEDLRERLLDKRRAQESSDRRIKMDPRSRRSQQQQEMMQQHQQQLQQQQQQQQPLPPPVRHETAREKAERLERELRKERLLEADREMVRQKEVYRRELEARRERRHLEKEKELEVSSTGERSESRERKRRKLESGEQPSESDGEDVLGKDELMVVTLSDDSDGSPEERMDANSGANVSAGEGDIVVEEVSSGGEEASSDGEEDDDDDDDDDEEDSETSSGSDDDGAAADTDDSRGRHTDNEDYEGSPRSVKRERDSPERTSPPPAAVGVNDKKPTKTDENGIPFISDSPKSDAVLKEELPPYLPAIQGCRNVEEFQCLNRIEEGTYGVVYRARDKRTNEVVALKRLKMEKEKEGFPITSLREINTLLKAQHPNIVTVREIVVGSNMDKIFIVMDYVEHDLKSLMETMKQKKQVFIPGEVKCLMQQLLRAVAHLHDNWILHRDLKTSNLLLSHKGILKVGDFGLAREYGSPLKPYTPVVVTLWYRAPELLLCTKEYSTPVDMWSVGCIFGEFLSMEALFPGKTEVDQLNRIFKDLGTPNEKIWPGYNKLPAVQKMTFAEYPVNQLRNRFGAMITDVGMDLMNRFLTYDPAQRITAEAALSHDYFKEAPLPIDPAMFPTWPAKSELGHRKAAAASPKPPPGGHEYKQLGDDEEVPAGGFHMGVIEKGRVAVGAGFSLKF